MKIIVQAGGLGTRMEELTRCKPKTLIPVKNKPILFHLTDEFCKESDEIIIVGDYKFDVLDDYTTTFLKNRRYILIKARGKGNAAGIRQALKYVDDDEQVLIVWSDLILPMGFRNKLEDVKLQGEIAVGTVKFQCSWQLIDGKLQKTPGTGHGLAGVYLFENKEQLRTVPEEGSFTSWLSKVDTPLIEMQLDGCIDIGTKIAYQGIEKKKFRCRPYNHIEAKDEWIIKSGLTDEARVYIDREVEWYLKAKDLGVNSVPALKARTPMTIKRIKGSNVFLSRLNEEQKRNIFRRIVDALADMHQKKTMRANVWDLYQEYFSKTVSRLQTVQTAIPLANQAYIKINGKRCRNVIGFRNLFRESVLSSLMRSKFAFYHGDCQLTNILLDENGQIFFIDPRGYFGRTKIYGDVRYDWAKLYYAICGNFDQYNIKNFKLNINNEGVNYEIGSGGWEFLKDEFFKDIPQDECNKKEIELIHSIIWLSMASHAWEDYDSMCIAFYNGTYLFETWLEKYNDSSFTVASYMDS